MNAPEPQEGPPPRWVDPQTWLAQIYEAVPLEHPAQMWIEALATKFPHLDADGRQAVGLALELGLALKSGPPS